MAVGETEVRELLKDKFGGKDKWGRRGEIRVIDKEKGREEYDM